ncbi:MAG: hypothetical protein M3619_02615, partial [Myxococcota bacterium]|nr:hypothetical protein [Myxococcota bacterium]
AACTSTRLASRADVGPITTRKIGDAHVVETTSPWRSRLDPSSMIRLHRGDGAKSSWLAARDLHVAKDGIYVPAVVDVLDHTVRIQIRGLDQEALGKLSSTRPALGAALEVDSEGTAIASARGKILRTWIWDFVDAVGLHHLPADHEVCTIRRCVRSELQKAAYAHLRHELDGRPLGTWTLELTHDGSISVAGALLFDRLEPGMGARHGWRWSDVAYVEIEDFSGAKTLGAIVGVTALSIALAPVALVVRGGPAVLGRRASSGGGGGGILGSGPGGIGNGRARLFSGRGDWPRATGSWKPMLADPAGMAAPALFSARARRRATVQVVATAEAAIDPYGAAHVLDGGVATVRFAPYFELGMGGAHLAARTADGWWHGGLAFVRMGAHLPIDAAHRYAVPLTIDAGGGGGEQLGFYGRLRWGLQRKLGDRAFVGVMPLSPTMLNWKHGGPGPAAKRWSVTSGVELGLAF